MKPGILVTGSHRSGSTWAGRMLCAGGGAFYIHEPFNNVRMNEPKWVPASFPYWFAYLTGEAPAYKPLLDDVVAMRYPLIATLRMVRTPAHLARTFRDWAFSLRARALGLRPLLKDPIALFSAEWLARTYGLDVVVLFRHPAGFAASLKRLDWWFKFPNWLEQKDLMRDLLPDFEEPIRRYMAGPKDIVEQGILMWNAMYSVVGRYRRNHPEWIFVRQEDLAADPIPAFRDLYARCNLPWNNRAEREVAAYSLNKRTGSSTSAKPGQIRRNSRSTITSWKRDLTEREIRRIYEGTLAIAGTDYSESDWV
jgi:hypothetical protein